MDSAFGRGARDLHLPDHAFDQERALQTWCLPEEISLLFSIPLKRSVQKRGCIKCCAILVCQCGLSGGNDSV